MKSHLNRKLIALVAGTAAVLGVGVHLIHTAQVARNASVWLRLAERARAQGRPQQCLAYTAQYLTFCPADVDALAEYGALLDESAATPKERWRAHGVLEQVLARRPDRQDVRRRLARLAMKLGRNADARAQLEILRATSPRDGELDLLLGRCAEAMGDYSQAVSWYERGVEHSPTRVDNYVRLAELLQYRFDQPRRAREVLDRLVDADGQSFAPYLARARFHQRRAAVELAAWDLERARRLAPEEPDVLLGEAELARATHTPTASCDHLRRGLAAHPDNVQLYLALAGLEAQSGRPRQGVACLRQGLKALPDQADLLQGLADLLIEQGALTQAAEAVARLRRTGCLPAQAGYWDARLLIRRERWHEAARLLERSRVQLAGVPEWVAQVDLALGRCYERLGDNDRALAAYRRAVTQDPLSGVARQGLAAALVTAGRLGEAVDEYRQLVKLPDVPAAAWAALARALLMRNLQRPAERREWPELEHAINQATRVLGDDPTVLLLRADVLVARQEPTRARVLLEEARDRDPGRVEVWVALALLADGQGESVKALRILDEAQHHLGDQVELRLARLRYLTRRGTADGRRALLELEHDLGSFPPEEQQRFLSELADTYYRIGESAQAKRLYRELAARFPEDLRCRLVLVDLYLRASDDAGLRGVLGDLRRIEGKGGMQCRCGEVARQIMRARHGDRGGLAEARAQLVEVARERPAWPLVPLLQAALDDFDGKPERTITNYLKAMDLGDRQPGVVFRLVQLLYERRRYAEADHAIRLLQEQAPVRGRLAALAAEVALANHSPGRAADLAHQAVLAQSRDYHDLLWLSHILEAAGRRAEAEDVLRTAVHRAGTVPEPWVALVRHLGRAGRTSEAEDAIRQAQQRLGPAQAPLAVAECYEALGRLNRAGEYYRAALASAPGDFLVVQKVASFYLAAGRTDEAELLLRHLTEPALATPPGQLAWARRQLALLLVAGDGAERFREALALVDQNLAARAGSVEDQRARARVLATRPERRREALRLLEASLGRQPLAADDQQLLAQLYDDAGDWPKARKELLDLLADHGGDARYVAHYVQSLLRWGDAAEARRWLAVLERLEPEAPRTVALREAVSRSRQPRPAPGG
jgi:tetratricopeptide (TPR) repeat protein